jgi:hypothetical protein
LASLQVRVERQGLVTRHLRIARRARRRYDRADVDAADRYPDLRSDGVLPGDGSPGHCRHRLSRWHRRHGGGYDALVDNGAVRSAILSNMLLCLRLLTRGVDVTRRMYVRTSPGVRP